MSIIKEDKYFANCILWYFLEQDSERAGWDTPQATRKMSEYNLMWQKRHSFLHCVRKIRKIFSVFTWHQKMFKLRNCQFLLLWVIKATKHLNLYKFSGKKSSLCFFLRKRILEFSSLWVTRHLAVGQESSYVDEKRYPFFEILPS